MLDPSRREPDRSPRLARAAAVCGPSGKLCPAERATQLLEAIIEPGDRVVIEADNQKQADFLAAALAKADPARLHDLHMVQSVLALPDHLVVFERGIANRLDFAFAGPQGRRLADRDARAHRALAVAIGFPAVAATHGRSSVTWRSVMKVLITALALVTLIASPTFAQRQNPGEFYPADDCQSGQNEYCDYPGGPVWHCWEDVRCSAR
jgi:malonate decarboxylase alpha subunit